MRRVPSGSLLTSVPLSFLVTCLTTERSEMNVFFSVSIVTVFGLNVNVVTKLYNAPTRSVNFPLKYRRIVTVFLPSPAHGEQEGRVQQIN